MIDQAQAPQQPFLNGNQPQPQDQQQNPLSGLTRAAPPQVQMTRAQLIAGLHHLGSFTKEFSPLLQSPKLGKGNIRPQIFERAAALMAAGIFTGPEIINGVKDLPDDPIDQKKWLQTKLANAQMAEQKLVQDYIAQGPSEDAGPDYSADSHREHMTGLMGNYKRA